jgi:hypothetical protein
MFSLTKKLEIHRTQDLYHGVREEPSNRRETFFLSREEQPQGKQQNCCDHKALNPVMAFFDSIVRADPSPR